MSISICFEQIPEDEGIDTGDYPEYTSFIPDDSRPKRDPVTFQLIRPKRRARIYPDDIVKDKYCLSTAKTIDITGFFLKSYKNNRTKNSRYLFGYLDFLYTSGLE